MQLGRKMHSSQQAPATLVLLALLIPFIAYADTTTTLASNRVRLTQAEIQGLGFFGQFEPPLPTDQVTMLYLKFPARIDGRKFIDATAELVELGGQANATEPGMARNQNDEKLLVISGIDPNRVTTIEFVLQYGADMQYEVSIDVASLNSAPASNLPQE